MQTDIVILISAFAIIGGAWYFKRRKDAKTRRDYYNEFITRRAHEITQRNQMLSAKAKANPPAQQQRRYSSAMRDTRSRDDSHMNDHLMMNQTFHSTRAHDHHCSNDHSSHCSSSDYSSDSSSSSSCD